jgi:NAD+ synthase (glutamine-hydrolysing)
VKLLVFPELCISGYTCNDLFLQDILLDGCLAGLEQIRSASAAMDMVIVAGLPFLLHARLYNVAAVLFRGRLLGLVPKQHIPNYSEFYEARHFAPAPADNEHVNIPVLGAHGHQIPFGAKLLFARIFRILFSALISAKISGCRFRRPAIMPWHRQP